MSASQPSSSSTVRQLAVGNEPMMPARQAAFTSAGPETRNIGAAISGRRRRLFERGGQRHGSRLPQRSMARSTIPTVTSIAAAMRRGPKPSFSTIVPSTAPKITLVSRSADTGPSGRLLAATR